MESLATVLNDSLPATTEGGEESAPLSSLAYELLTIGQTPQRAPDATHFWYPLSQTCLRSGKVERGTIEDGQSIVTDRQTRIVARYLDEGRSSATRWTATEFTAGSSTATRSRRSSG